MEKSYLLKSWVTDSQLHLFTDASSVNRFGAVFQTHWFYGPWSEEFVHMNITFKELFPIVIATKIWGSKLQNRCLVLHSDDQAVVHILNKQTSKDTNIMNLVRQYSCKIVAHSRQVEYFSRFTFPFKKIAEFKARAKNIDAYPTNIQRILADISLMKAYM